MSLVRTLIPAVALAALASPGFAQPVYLALGDSVAFGQQTTLTRSDGDQGYVAPFATWLGSHVYGGQRPIVQNLALSGETSNTFANGGNPAAADNSNYDTTPSDSQAQKLAAVIGQETLAGNSISDITYSLGADNLLSLGTPAFLLEDRNTQLTQINSVITATVQGEGAFLAGLESNPALAHTQIYLLSYYDPFQTFAQPVTFQENVSNTLSSLVSYANSVYAGGQQTLAAQYRNNVHFVDISGLPVTDTYNANPDQNPLFPEGVHPNTAGYDYIAGQLEQAAAGQVTPQPTPEPGAIAAFTLGGLSLLGLALRRRAHQNA